MTSTDLDPRYLTATEAIRPRRNIPAGPHTANQKHTALGARYRRMRGHVGHGRAVLAVGRNVLKSPTTCLANRPPTANSGLTTSTATAPND